MGVLESRGYFASKKVGSLLWVVVMFAGGWEWCGSECSVVGQHEQSRWLFVVSVRGLRRVRSTPWRRWSSFIVGWHLVSSTTAEVSRHRDTGWWHDLVCHASDEMQRSQVGEMFLCVMCLMRRWDHRSVKWSCVSCVWWDTEITGRWNDYVCHVSDETQRSQVGDMILCVMCLVRRGDHRSMVLVWNELVSYHLVIIVMNIFRNWNKTL